MTNEPLRTSAGRLFLQLQIPEILKSPNYRFFLGIVLMTKIRQIKAQVFVPVIVF